MARTRGAVSKLDPPPLQTAEPSLAERRVFAHDEPLEEGDLAELPPQFCREWLGGGRFARIGTEGRGSCFYWSLCASLNFRGFMHLPLKEKRAIVNEFRCAFAAGAAAQNNAAELERVRAELARSRSKFSARSPQELESEFCAPHVWANEATIRLVSRLLSVNVIVVHMRAGTPFCGVHRAETLRAALDTSQPLVSPRSIHRSSPQQHREVVLDPTVTPESPRAHRTILVAWTNRSQHFEAIVRLVDASAATGAAKIQGVLQPACSAEDARTVRALMERYAASCAARGAPLAVP